MTYRASGRKREGKEGTEGRKMAQGDSDASTMRSQKRHMARDIMNTAQYLLVAR